CIKLCYWRSSNARWTPDRIREPEVKRDGKEVHCAREIDDDGFPLLEDLEALFVGVPGHPRIIRTWALDEGHLLCKDGDDVRHFIAGPWKSVSMDFITCLPKSERGGSIIVVVDRFSKYRTFIAAPPDVMADDTAKIFFKNVRSQPNLVLAKLLDVAQFSYNMQRSEATGKSPFELVTGRQPLTPNALAVSYEGMIGRVGKVSYRVQLPPKLKIYPVFHISFLKPYHGDGEDPERGVSKQAPTAVVTSYDQEVEEILLDLKQVRKRKTYCDSLRIRSRDITRMARRGRQDLVEFYGRWEKVLEALGNPWKT
ncbi:reverse transcriptase, partial [Tanacetum coccineum]